MKLSAKLAILGFAVTVVSFVFLFIVAYSPNDVLRDTVFYFFLGGYGILLLGGMIEFVARLRAKHLRLIEYPVIGLAVLFGFSIWLLSSTITGISEPWDAPHFYYPLTMLFSGFICGLLLPRCWYLSAIAITIGQFPAANFGLGPFGPLTAMFLVVGGLPALVGCMAGAGVTTGLRWIFRGRDQNTQQPPGESRWSVTIRKSKGKAFVMATALGALPAFVFHFILISQCFGTKVALSGSHGHVLFALPFGLVVGFITLGVMTWKDKGGTQP